MKTDKYILQLLARHGKATVPGLGVFSLEHRNAILSNSTILPPGDIVVFAEDRNCHDNALAELIMRDRKIRFEEAAAMVSDSAATLDINKFTGWHNNLPQNYGLTAINVTEIRHDNIFTDLGKYAAAVAVALLVNLSVPVNKVSDTQTAEARFIPEFFANAPETEEPIAEPSEEEIAEPKNYCIIVSSLDSREEAVNWIIAKTGCDSLEIVEGDGHFRVSAARFATYCEAASYIKTKEISAWVLHTK